MLLLPGVAAHTAVSPQPRSVADADTQGRDYVAVAGGASDSTVGDLLVLTTVECGDTGCDRDVWYRFLHAPSQSPTIDGVVEPCPPPAPEAPGTPALDVDAVVEALTTFANASALFAAALAENVADGCWNGAVRFLFTDLPVATTAADESDAFTDGRWVVYASGPPTGPKDVFRFDARNPDDPPVLVAGTAAHEIPFGVGGDWVGVRTTLPDGRNQSLVIKRFNSAGALQETRTLSARVNATDGAAMSQHRVAWAAGPTLFTHHVNHVLVGGIVGTTTYQYDGEATFLSPAVWRHRVAYVRSYECTPTPADTACNSLTFDPPRRFDTRIRIWDSAPTAPTNTVAFADPPALNENFLGARSTRASTTVTCADDVLPTSASFPTAPRLWFDLLILDRTTETVGAAPACARTASASLQLFEWNTAVTNLGIPAAYTNRPVGSIGGVAFTNHYLVFLDYDVGGKASLKAHPYVSCYATKRDGPAQDQHASTRCIGAGPLSP